MFLQEQIKDIIIIKTMQKKADDSCIAGSLGFLQLSGVQILEEHE
jgi:hypothetical protein